MSQWFHLSSSSSQLVEKFMPQLLERTESAISMTMLAMKLLASLLSRWLLNRLEGGVEKELTPSEPLENTRPFVSRPGRNTPTQIQKRETRISPTEFVDGSVYVNLDVRRVDFKPIPLQATNQLVHSVWRVNVTFFFANFKSLEANFFLLSSQN